MILIDPVTKKATRFDPPPTDEISLHIPPGKLPPGSGYHLIVLCCANCGKQEVYGMSGPWGQWAMDRFLDDWKRVWGKLGPKKGRCWGWTCSKACREAKGIPEPTKAQINT